jgi:hypothetical protein
VSSACTVTSDEPVVVSYEDLGPLTRPASVRAVAGGQTALVGSRVLWSFSEAFLAAPASNGDTWRSTMAGLSAPSDPLSLAYDLDPAGAPVELLPLDASERAFNAAHAPDESLVVWPMGMVTVRDGSGLVYYAKIDAKPGYLNLASVSAGVAVVAPGQSVALRDPSPLFVAPEPQFGPGANVVGDEVYVYGCTGGFAPKDGCKVARAPLDRARDRTAYEVWDGATWTHVLTQAVVVFDWVPGGASVAWHPHLGKFLATYTEPFGDRVMMRSAPRPEGPWTSATPMFPTIGNPVHSGAEQAVLAKDCGRDTVVTYYDEKGSFDGQIRAMRVHLK